MKPYYVVALVGDVDENGNSKQFGLLGADDPQQAETMLLNLAKENKDKACSFGVLQLYRSYPATLLAERNECKARLENYIQQYDIQAGVVSVQKGEIEELKEAIVLLRKRSGRKIGSKAGRRKK